MVNATQAPLDAIKREVSNLYRTAEHCEDWEAADAIRRSASFISEQIDALDLDAESACGNERLVAA